MGNATLKSVAAAAGCSVAVASTVLNNSGGNTKVGSKTRARVLKVAGELNYHPNFASWKLKTGQARTIGIYAPPHGWNCLSNTYAIHIFHGVELAVRDSGYDLLVVNLGGQAAPELCDVRLRERRIDGLILVYCDGDEPWVDGLLDYSPNIVAVDCYRPNPRLNRVLFDNAEAVRLAVRHLAEHGHRRIGFISCCLSESASLDAGIREEAFREAVKLSGCDEAPELVLNAERFPRRISFADRYCHWEGTEALHYFRSLKSPPTAVLAYNVLVAVAFLHEAQRVGVRVPGDLSIVGIDDMEFTDYIVPKLTLVDHRLPEMGAAAVKILVDQIAGHNSDAPREEVLSPKLLPGESVRDLRGG